MTVVCSDNGSAHDSPGSGYFSLYRTSIPFYARETVSIPVNPGAATADDFRESGLDTAGASGVLALMLQQPPLAFQASAVTGQ